MEAIIIGRTIVPTATTLDALTDGQMAILLYNNDERTAPVLKGADVTNTELKNARGVQFIKMRADGEYDASLIIPNKTVRNRNYQPYVAGVAAVFRLGNNAAELTALNIPSEGEATIRIMDLTQSYVTNDFPANISVTKKPTETPAQFLTKVVAAINNDPKAKLLVTAALATNAGKYHITLTTKSYKIKLGVALDDIFEGVQAVATTERVMAVGTGEQIAAIEKELTVFKGNGNYYQDGDLYYKEPLVASLSTNHNTLSLTWTAVAQPSVSTTIFQATVNLLVCVPAADGTLLELFEAFTTPDPVV